MFWSTRLQTNIPLYEKYSHAIERVKHIFLKYIQHKCHLNYVFHKDILNKFKLLPLGLRRRLLQVMMLYGLIYNHFDCPDLVNEICYIVPRTVIRCEKRAYPLFATTQCRTTAVERAPLQKIVKNYNQIYQSFIDFDIFVLSRSHFRNNIIKLLKM